ncbi:MAG: hypothetical protein ABJA67_07810, partial [Chthonomonadales bacterium]
VYLRKMNEYALKFQLTFTEDFVQLNRDTELTINFTNRTRLRNEYGETDIESYIKDGAVGAIEGVPADLRTSGLQMEVLGLWIPISVFVVTYKTRTIRYIKYVKPTEYVQLQDHVRDTATPIYFSLDTDFQMSDDSFIQLPQGEIPEFSGLNIEVEENAIISV